MAWPSITEFSEAVQNPSQCFDDDDLRQGEIAVNSRGFPLVYSGNFACVYKVVSGGRSYAVRCFTREVKDQQHRYEQLSNYLERVRPDYFVTFEYIERGVLVKGSHYPIVKMAWVEGSRLDSFAENNLNSPLVLQEMAARWRGVNGGLRGLRIAHNDLQHGNILVQNDSIRLVDYDGIFLNPFQGQESPEVGHRHYQHPKRSASDYNEQIDNFPSLVLYLSLTALSVHPELWAAFYNQENLLFTNEDYVDPDKSELFRLLCGSRDKSVAELADRLGDCCLMSVDEVPDLETVLQGGQGVAASIPASTLTVPPLAVKPAPVATGRPTRQPSLAPNPHPARPAVQRPAPVPPNVPTRQPSLASGSVSQPPGPVAAPEYAPGPQGGFWKVLSKVILFGLGGLIVIAVLLNFWMGSWADSGDEPSGAAGGAPVNPPPVVAPAATAPPPIDSSAITVPVPVPTATPTPVPTLTPTLASTPTPTPTLTPTPTPCPSKTSLEIHACYEAGKITAEQANKMLLALQGAEATEPTPMPQSTATPAPTPTITPVPTPTVVPDRPGRVTIGSTFSAGNIMLQARLLDPDGGIRNESWSWQLATHPITGWTTIPGATSSSYTPSRLNWGKYIQATVVYSDGHGPNKRAVKFLEGEGLWVQPLGR